MKFLLRGTKTEFFTLVIAGLAQQQYYYRHNHDAERLGRRSHAEWQSAQQLVQLVGELAQLVVADQLGRQPGGVQDKPDRQLPAADDDAGGDSLPLLLHW
jgi:hypothetical protein